MSAKLSSRIQVAVRLRPVLKNEDEEKEPSVRGISDKALEILNWRDSEQTLRFDFDAYFDSKASQRAVYVGCVKPLLSHAINGQNASVFAYGPTGTGKTFTMLGTEENPGVIPRSLNHIFTVIASEKTKTVDSSTSPWSYNVSFSYLEIYQEKIYDLLEPKGHDLPIREDQQRNIFIPKLAEKTITSFSEFAKHFIPASKNRTIAATKLNSRSSRSHSILLLKIVKERTEGSKHHKQTGKLYLIDLAGSENNKKTGNKGIRMKESGAINTSLFVLGQVVDALNQKLPRIPYRDSKLTRLLQDSLGGSAHACMITNVAPEPSNYMDTYTTLHFATKSKQIVNRPFTRETTTVQTTTAPAPAPPRKRSLGKDKDGGGAIPSAKTRAVERGGKPVPVSGGSNSAIMKPLMDRQANFEATVQQRLQSLEQNLLHQFKNAKSQPKTPTSRKVLSEVQNMRRELAKMKPKSGGIQTTFDRRATFTRTHSGRPRPPQAVVKPLPVASIPARHSAAAAADDDDDDDYLMPLMKRGKVQGSKPKVKRSTAHKPKAVQFVKAVSSSKSSVLPEGTENQVELRLDPEFQTKHKNQILKTLNEGSVKQLKSLQSVGEKRAQLIHNWRLAFGEFGQVEDLYKVKGLPSKTVDNILGNNLLCISAANR